MSSLPSSLSSRSGHASPQSARSSAAAPRSPMLHADRSRVVTVPLAPRTDASASAPSSPTVERASASAMQPSGCAGERERELGGDERAERLAVAAEVEVLRRDGAERVDDEEEVVARDRAAGAALRRRWLVDAATRALLCR